jgi:hypothetical protein
MESYCICSRDGTPHLLISVGISSSLKSPATELQCKFYLVYTVDFSLGSSPSVSFIVEPRYCVDPTNVQPVVDAKRFNMIELYFVIKHIFAYQSLDYVFVEDLHGEHK